jgi:hypothetical protein
MMNFRYIKILMVALVLVFATQGCAVFVRDRDPHYRYRHWDDHGRRRKHHSSLQQSPQSVVQLANSEDSGHKGQVAW